MSAPSTRHPLMTDAEREIFDREMEQWRRRRKDRQRFIERLKRLDEATRALPLPSKENQE